MDVKIKLSTLWMILLFNMIYADIYSIIIELVHGGILDIPGDVHFIMAIAAILTNIPIIMVFLSRYLRPVANRRANIGAALFTILYIIGGGDTAWHYLIIASIEILLLVIILVTAWTWKEVEDSVL
ncbi:MULTISPECIES: DUF6326 family protein [unclassified Aureispira]|uniref:DUF6326 family protein n=1 Tax=unclassified Aureispira TaxID=2649989 RepID=UPI000698BB9E|nr:MULTISPECIES: DUF6326 family protein [unclassified Aureispira]WMX12965.1 DUF6326 family protein [Aureispira sp. CCB-E]